MVRRSLSYNVVQLVDMVYNNYKKCKSHNDLQDLEYPNNNLVKVGPKVSPNKNTMKQYPNSDELRSLEFSRIPSALLPEYFAISSYPYVKKCVSYSVFLQHNPGASKKQRIDAIKRFYDNLY